MPHRNQCHHRFYFLIAAAVIFLYLATPIPYVQKPQGVPPPEQEFETLTVNTNLT